MGGRPFTRKTGYRLDKQLPLIGTIIKFRIRKVFLEVLSRCRRRMSDQRRLISLARVNVGYVVW